MLLVSPFKKETTDRSLSYSVKPFDLSFHLQEEQSCLYRLREGQNAAAAPLKRFQAIFRIWMLMWQRACEDHGVDQMF